MCFKTTEEHIKITEDQFENDDLRFKKTEV